jgi:hypothetical protein
VYSNANGMRSSGRKWQASGAGEAAKRVVGLEREVRGASAKDIGWAPADGTRLCQSPIKPLRRQPINSPWSISKHRALVQIIRLVPGSEGDSRPFAVIHGCELVWPGIAEIILEGDRPRHGR